MKNNNQLENIVEQVLKKSTVVPSTQSVVYGVFYAEAYEGQVLMGLYSSEEKAVAAKEAYISDSGYPRSSKELENLKTAVVISTLTINQPARYDFVS